MLDDLIPHNDPLRADVVRGQLSGLEVLVNGLAVEPEHLREVLRGEDRRVSSKQVLEVIGHDAPGVTDSSQFTGHLARNGLIRRDFA